MYYSSKEVARFLKTRHKQLLKWCDDYYEEYKNDKEFILDIKPMETDKGNKYYLVTNEIINYFGSMLRGDRGKYFLKIMLNGNIGCSEIDKFLNLDTRLGLVIRENVTSYRIEVEKKLNDGKYYYHYTSLIYSILNIDLPKGANPRDILDKRMLIRLEDMEDKVADMIEKLADDGIYYKDVYKLIKKEIG